MTTAFDLTPTPCRRVRGSRCRLGPAEQAIAGYTLFFVVSLSLFGAMVFLSLLP